MRLEREMIEYVTNQNPKGAPNANFVIEQTTYSKILQMSHFLSVEYQNEDLSLIEDCYKGVQLSQKDIRSNTFATITGVF